MIATATATANATASTPHADDFTGLADDYARYRPGYAPEVIARIVGMVGKPAAEIDAADVGAGTGICARMLADAGIRRIVAIEPNADMLRRGSTGGADCIDWRQGSGERTGLASASIDLLCMATAFHWVDFKAGTRESARVLRPGGCFVAMWNPRVIDDDPLMREIEGELAARRGRPTPRAAGPAFPGALSAALLDSGCFGTVDYLEGEHAVGYTPDQYLGLMRSVKHLRADLGAAGLAGFLDWLERRLRDLPLIEARYQTRAWVARTPEGP